MANEDMGGRMKRCGRPINLTGEFENQSKGIAVTRDDPPAA